MKGILVILDGIGDRACKQLHDRTPLEIAEKPNLDYLTEHGKLGLMNSIKPGVAPESDTAVISILGNKPQISARGVFEAIGAGLDFKRGDLALRTNFATITSLPGEIIDRRAGRTLTTKEANILGKEVNKVYLPRKFVFKPTIQHRGVLILRGGFSDNITNTDTAYPIKEKIKDKMKFRFSKALDEEENSQYTANMVNELIENSFKRLDEHPVNQAREKKGLLPANILLTRDAGTEIPKLNKMKNWVGIQYMPLEIGICKTAGMGVFSFNYPNMKKFDVYQNLYIALEKAAKFAIKMLKKNKKKFDYAYIHFKETDVPGHDNKPLEKKAMIELLDRKFFSFLRKFAEKNKIKVAVTADHSTPCNLKVHSGDPVPVLLFEGGKERKRERDETLSFNEIQAKKGELGEFNGQELLKKIGFQ
jgi:2,3-bisphosphoglycerate-independent phosphoglycerate mutase